MRFILKTAQKNTYTHWKKKITGSLLQHFWEYFLSYVCLSRWLSTAEKVRQCIVFNTATQSKYFDCVVINSIIINSFLYLEISYCKRNIDGENHVQEENLQFIQRNEKKSKEGRYMHLYQFWSNLLFQIYSILIKSLDNDQAIIALCFRESQNFMRSEVLNIKCN